MTQTLSAPVLAMPADRVELTMATFTPSDWRALNRKGDPHQTIHDGKSVLAIVWADDFHSEIETAERFKRAYRAHDLLIDALTDAANVVTDPALLARIKRALAVAEVEPKGGDRPAVS